MTDSIKLQFSDFEFEVKALPIRKDREWRKEMVERLRPILGTVEALPDLDFSKPDGFLKLTGLAEHILTQGLDDVLELLFMYSPELAKERDWIEDNATTRQAVNAFMEVVALDNPFDFTRLRGKMSGPANGETSKK